MILELTQQEKAQFAQLLPAQASLSELMLVRSILIKTQLSESDVVSINNPDLIKIEFSQDEIKFLLQEINLRDSTRQLPFASLDLILKIKEIESQVSTQIMEENNG